MRCRTPRRLPGPSSPTLPTKTIVPSVGTFSIWNARATASTTASPRQSSPMPGARISVPSRFTFTSVPSGKTVSRCPASITVGPRPVPFRSAMTLPIESIRTVSPSPSSRRLYSVPRAVSLNGGAGISQIDCCWSSVHALSALMRSTARATDAGAAWDCARAGVASARAESPATVASVRRLPMITAVRSGVMWSAGGSEGRVLRRGGGVELPVERGGELPRYAARLPGADRTSVELDDRGDVARGAGDEQLVEPADLLLEDRRLAYGHALLDRQLEHDVARDAGEDVVGSRIGAELAVDDAEHVRVRALGDDAVANEHRLERSGRDRMLLCKHRA